MILMILRILNLPIPIQEMVWDGGSLNSGIFRILRILRVFKILKIHVVLEVGPGAVRHKVARRRKYRVRNVVFDPRTPIAKVGKWNLWSTLWCFSIRGISGKSAGGCK